MTADEIPAEITAAWERVREAVTANYVSDDGWDAIKAFDELVEGLAGESEPSPSEATQEP